MAKQIGIALTIGIVMAAPLLLAAEKNAPTLRAVVDRKDILIGERIRYTVEITSRKILEVKFPKFENGRLGDLELKDSKSLVKKSLFGRRAFRNRYDVTSYAVGGHAIPSIEIKYLERGAKDWQTLKTKVLSITVTSVLPKDVNVTDIKDVKGPLYFFEINWALVTAVSVALISGGLLFAAYYRRRSRKPLKLPHETALEELEAIKTFLSQGGDVKEYYIRISDCVRRYIERRFGLRAPEMTTEEFLNSLRDSKKLSNERKALLRDFLASCDLVKFAKYAPQRQEVDAVYSTANKFVEETKPSDVHV